MLADRAAAGLPPLAETDILMALEVEEASIAREKAALEPSASLPVCQE